jgi:hypothetical protein
MSAFWPTGSLKQASAESKLTGCSATYRVNAAESSGVLINVPEVLLNIQVLFHLRRSLPLMDRSWIRFSHSKSDLYHCSV